MNNQNTRLNISLQNKCKKAIFYRVYTLYICKPNETKRDKIMSTSFLMTTEQKANKGFSDVSTSKDKDGNGQYETLKRQKKSSKKKQEFTYLTKNTNRRMRFNNAKDPIYVVFDYFENKSVVDLAMDFVKDSMFELKTLVSKMAK